MPFAYASTGLPGRIGVVHIDVIEDIRAPRDFDMTNTALERGAPIANHRQRVPYQIQVTVVLSDAEPIAGSGIVGLWEPAPGHVDVILKQLYLLQELGTEVTFFDGKKLWRAPTGARVWVISNIEDGKTVELNGGFTVQAWRGVITLKEVSRFSTSFTTVPSATDPGITDSVDGIVDAGQQSTETVPADLAATIPG
jgi:hypothetical protein